MSGVPYIRFFGDDWLSGTQDLSLEERGALITIVALTSATGNPPAADYQRLSRRFGCTPNKAKKLVAALVDLGKITIEDEAIHNARALKETEISRKNSKKQSEAAQKKWSKKTEKSNENSDGSDAAAYATAKPRQCQPDPEPEPIEEESKASSSSAREAREEEDPYQRYLEAHPSPVESPDGERQFDALVKAGEDPEKIIAAAKAYAAEVARWSADAKVQRSHNFLDPDRGKWREFVPAPRKPPPSREDRLRAVAQLIQTGKPFLCQNVTAVSAREAIHHGLVSQQQCEAVGVL